MPDDPTVTHKPYLPIWVAGVLFPLSLPRFDRLLWQGNFRPDLLCRHEHQAQWAEVALLVVDQRAMVDDLMSFRYFAAVARAAGIPRVVVVIDTRFLGSIGSADQIELRLRHELDVLGYSADDIPIWRISLFDSETVTAPQEIAHQTLFDELQSLAPRGSRHGDRPLWIDPFAFPFLRSVDGQYRAPVEAHVVRSGVATLDMAVDVLDDTRVVSTKLQGLHGPLHMPHITQHGVGFSAHQWAVEALWKPRAHALDVGDRAMLSYRGVSSFGSLPTRVIAAPGEVVRGWDGTKKKIRRLWTQSGGWQTNAAMLVGEAQAQEAPASDPEALSDIQGFYSDLWVGDQRIETEHRWTSLRWRPASRAELIVMRYDAVAELDDDP